MIEEKTYYKRIIEGSILAAGEPLTVERIQSLFDEEDAPDKAALLVFLNEITVDCEGRGFDLVEVASGWRFQIREDVALWVNRLWEEKPQKYSRAMLETLALIAYRQPLTRGDIEEVRGVAVSSSIIKGLVERNWVKVVGHRDVPGRPALFATTRLFLDYFNLKSLDELPSLGELKDIDGLTSTFDFEGTGNSADVADVAASETANDGSAEQLELGDDAGSKQINEVQCDDNVAEIAGDDTQEIKTYDEETDRDSDQDTDQDLAKNEQRNAEREIDSGQEGQVGTGAQAQE
ncbi:MAG: segregation and condensation protein B [Lentisphaeria bacterium]|jgi:segregation and condensation protein B